MNKVFLLGNLGAHPRVRATQAGTPVATFSMATNRRWTDRDGNRQEKTEWHNIVCFARLAEIAQQFLERGKKILVEGELKTTSWEDKKTGETKYRTEVVAKTFEMIGNGNSNAAPGAQAPTQDLGPGHDDEDIAF